MNADVRICRFDEDSPQVSSFESHRGSAFLAAHVKQVKENRTFCVKYQKSKWKNAKQGNG